MGNGYGHYPFLFFTDFYEFFGLFYSFLAHFNPKKPIFHFFYFNKTWFFE
jgi:hypothetical protein